MHCEFRQINSFPLEITKKSKVFLKVLGRIKFDEFGKIHLILKVIYRDYP